MTNIDEILAEREETHGDFSKTARTAYRLKTAILDSGYVYDEHTAVLGEALDMICLKMARILCGNSFETDHWRDIAGYATLVVNQIEKWDARKANA